MRTNTARSCAAGLSLGLTLALALSSGVAQEPTQKESPPGGPGGGPAFKMFPPPAGPGGFGGPGLMMIDAVQDDLGLTEKQKVQIKKLQGAMAKRTSEAFQAAQGGEVDPEEMRETMTSLQRENSAATNKVLDKNQKARLAQIELQREGLLAVAKSDMASKLKLTSTQAKKIKAIVEEMRQAQFKAMPPPPGGGSFVGGPTPDDAGKSAPKSKPANAKNRRKRPTADDTSEDGDMVQEGAGFPEGSPPGAGGFPGGQGFGPPGLPNFNSEEFRAQMAKMMEGHQKNRETAVKKIGEVLTPEQNSAFEKLLGKPFDFSKLPFGPPGARPPGDDATKTEEGAAKSDEEKPKQAAPAKSPGKMKSSRSSSP